MAKKKTKIAEDDFEALDRMARNISLGQLRPLTPEMRAQWEAAKRSGAKIRRGADLPMLDRPQLRRMIQRLVASVFSDCVAEFEEPPAGGIAFRVRAPGGGDRSGTIKLLKQDGHLRLNRAWLLQAVARSN